MKKVKNSNNPRIKLFLAILLLVALAGILGWKLGQNEQSDGETISQSEMRTNNFRDLISYTAPDGWFAHGCGGDMAYVYTPGIEIGPQQCSIAQNAPIKVSIDEAGITDCGQIPEVSGVQKRICKSLFIDGHKTLQAETVANGTTTAKYYINTKPEVVKIEYIFTGSNQYQPDFDRMVRNIKVEA